MPSTIVTMPVMPAPQPAGTIFLVGTLLIMSAISGKQQKYLLPMFPALALLGAYALAGLEHEWRPRRQALAALLLVRTSVELTSTALPVAKAWLDFRSRQRAPLSMSAISAGRSTT